MANRLVSDLSGRDHRGVAGVDARAPDRLHRTARGRGSTPRRGDRGLGQCARGSRQERCSVHRSGKHRAGARKETCSGSTSNRRCSRRNSPSKPVSSIVMRSGSTIPSPSCSPTISSAPRESIHDRARSAIETMRRTCTTPGGYDRGALSRTDAGAVGRHGFLRCSPRRIRDRAHRLGRQRLDRHAHIRPQDIRNG